MAPPPPIRDLTRPVIKSPLRLLFLTGFSLVCLGFSLLAVAALLGFASPVLDLFNHMQAVLFLGLAALLVAIALFVRTEPWRAVLLTTVATGLLSSAVIVVPEALAVFEPRPPFPTDGRPVYTLMTHNIFGRNYDMKRVAREILSADPDIVAIQEFFDPQRKRLAPLLDGRYPYHIACAGGRRAFVALFSKMRFTTDSSEECVTTGAKAQRVGRIIARFAGRDGRPFTVITTHLDWPLPTSRQTAEFAALAGSVNRVEGPLIVAGDFNSTSWSYALRRFAAGTGLTRQVHGLPTWPLRFYIMGWRNTFPFLPLDHVMTKNGIAVHSLALGAPDGSDHLAVIVKFTVGGPETGGAQADAVVAQSETASVRPSAVSRRSPPTR